MSADFDWLPALAGELCIGLAATLLLGGSGRIAGICGTSGARPGLVRRRHGPRHVHVRGTAAER
ncbi:MAG: hypothetical protein U5K33_00155 [Halofilum sp. (in: g-proteobacteria)]|nr:hypothetical protein [Halofilum sp. (in: g-proteobacteria)]